jgi:iron complex transport system permease protein
MTAAQTVAARASAPDLPVLRRPAVALAVAAFALVATSCVALAVGRFPVSVGQVLEILRSEVAGAAPSEQASRDVVLLVRLPRILLAVLVGGGLAVCGAALQAVFRNPLVSPQIIGVSSGASFGGALAIVLGLGSAMLVGFAFAFGLVAILVVYAVTRGSEGAPMLMVVLAGVVTGSFFSALVSLLTYVADPYDQLPAIVFWLLGSLATATFAKVAVAALPVLAGSLLLVLLRWRINVLSLGDDDAAAVGLRPAPARWTVLGAVALVVAGAVAVAGVVSWVGLVVPHIVRMWVGPDHRVLLPVSFLVGGVFLLVVDTVARTLTAGEIPLGVLTALIGAPVFFVLLRHNRQRLWDSA